MGTEKTNVIRLLEQKKVPYHLYTYNDTDAISGMEVVDVLNENPDEVFKTLVTQSKHNNYYVFMIPVNSELDLKKAAKSVNEKKIDLIPSKDLLKVTGYIHGGCSPIGMKKAFKTIIHQSVNHLDTIYFSAGKVGFQVSVKVNDLPYILTYDIFDITVKERDELPPK